MRITAIAAGVARVACVTRITAVAVALAERVAAAAILRVLAAVVATILATRLFEEVTARSLAAAGARSHGRHVGSDEDQLGGRAEALLGSHLRERLDRGSLGLSGHSRRGLRLGRWRRIRSQRCLAGRVLSRLGRYRGVLGAGGFFTANNLGDDFFNFCGLVCGVIHHYWCLLLIRRASALRQLFVRSISQKRSISQMCSRCALAHAFGHCGTADDLSIIKRLCVLGDTFRLTPTPIMPRQAAAPLM